MAIRGLPLLVVGLGVHVLLAVLQAVLVRRLIGGIIVVVDCIDAELGLGRVVVIDTN